MRRLPRMIAVLACASLAGCGGDRYPIAPVSGRVTLDGKPLAGARVGFEPRKIGDNPNAGPGSYAKTDADGRYTLTTLTGQSGAVITTHDVLIRTVVLPARRGDEIPTAIPEKVPTRYNDESTLTFTVPAEGTDQANFDLTSDAE